MLSEKAAKFLAEDAKRKASEKDSTSEADKHVALRKDRWTSVKLIKREKASSDTSVYTFELPNDKKILGLGTGQHLHVGFHLFDRMLTRPYTPTRPSLPPANKSKRDSGYEDNENFHDGDGTFDLTVKTYFPSEEQPGGAMSNILDTVPIGEEVDIKGPSGEILYHGNGNFKIEGKDRHFDRVSLVLGGTGVTPGYSIVARIAMEGGDETQLRIIDANNTQGDILMREQLEEFERRSNGGIKVVNVLSKPDENWKGLKGFVTEDMMREHLFEPSEGSVALMCGPPVMINKAVLPGLKSEFPRIRVLVEFANGLKISDIERVRICLASKGLDWRPWYDLRGIKANSRRPLVMTFTGLAYMDERGNILYTELVILHCNGEYDRLSNLTI